MQYLISVIDDKVNPGPPSDMSAIGAFNDRLRAQGYWVYANGLAAPDTATVVDGRGEEPIFTDGPYLESKEFLAGFWVLEAPNLDVVLKLATEGSKVCNRKLEVRPFHPPLKPQGH
jgi:hypothetical protein